ncbi:Phox domain containing protein [Globisporangium polare]
MVTKTSTSTNNSSLLHSTSLASTASSSSFSPFQVRTRALRPVAASIISYGRSSKIQDRHISKTTTLYVIRVARSGKDWYVARRYSEFRALHAALQTQFTSGNSRSCAACEELSTFYSGFHFPQRFRLRSALFSKKDIEPTRMNELNQYLSFLMETTQGLLDEDEDDNEEVERKDAVADDETKCAAMTSIRDFLMVDENEDLLKQQQQQEDKSPTRRRPRLSSKSVSSFRVHELDVLYKENDSGGCASCIDSLAPANATEFDCNPAFADVFEDFPSPPLDAIIQHQRSDDELPRSGGLHPLRRSESLSYSRR